MLRRLACSVSFATLVSSGAVRASMVGLAPIQDQHGSPLSEAAVGERLTGKRVGLYFTAGWCPMCTRFEPPLLQFREACQQSGKPIELIYVSSDENPEVQRKRALQLDMLQVAHDSAQSLKKQFGVWAGKECITFGLRRRSGVPAIVVLDTELNEATFLDAEGCGVQALENWPLEAHVF